MKVGSLFAGVGGFDIAAERAGMEVVWQSEVDKPASRVLDHYWPDLNLGDIHGITDTANVDVLCGGFPCQDYSVAGNRKGLAGDRGALWWEYLRLITEGRPTWVVAENVPGLLSSRGGEDFATIIDSLTECGYGVVWAVLDAQYFGVAQRRRRVFIVAHSSGRPRPEILALGEGMYGHPAPSRQTGQDIQCIPDARSEERSVSGTVTAGWDDKWYSQSYNVDAGSIIPQVAKTITSGIGRCNDPETDEHIVQRPLGNGSNVAQSLTSGYGKSTGQDLTGENMLIQEVTTSNVRRLTPLECERLQGFPDQWTNIEGNPDSQRYKQMGNAVAVPVVEWIMRRIAEAEA